MVFMSRKSHSRPSWVQVIAICLIIAALSVFITGYFVSDHYEKSIPKDAAYYKKLSEIKAYVDKWYVGEYSEDELLELLSSAMVLGINDKWAYYTSAEDYAALMESSAGSYTGIGVSVTEDAETGMLKIMEVYENSPAEEVGIRPLDMLYKVGDELVSELGRDLTVVRVRGEAGTFVRLTVVRDGQFIEFNVQRRQVKTQSIYTEIIDGNIGYMRISEFTQAAAEEFVVKLAVLKSAGIEGIIFDVRNNPGGSLSTLLTMLDEIVPEGVLFIQEDKAGNRITYSSDDYYFETDIVVLVNRYSYSAAEYFGAVLQEKGLARVIGEATTGKGEAQSTFRLSDGSAVTFSVFKYFTPAGVRISEKGGIIPDLAVEMADELTVQIGRLTYIEDPQLGAAVTVIRQLIYDIVD